MNEHDAEIICAMVESLGYSPSESADSADLIIINTCAVRKKPEDKVASLLGKFKPLKDKNPGLLIAVGGCMAQLKPRAAYLKQRFPQVNLIFGTQALPRLPALLEKAAGTKKTVIDIADEISNREGLPVKRQSFFKAWLPVIYGCNNYCAYCIVPYARGRENSRPYQAIIKEANNLARQGYLELTLLGQNVNSYGHDLPDKRSFAELLYDLNKITGLQRIRFMTSHPKDLSFALIRAVKENDRLCEHFHLPVQSGSNAVLKLMNRRYSKEHYLELLQQINEEVKGVAITSDIIVGFPGEEEKDFLETLDLVQKARFDNIFSFLYSARADTRAASLPGQVEEAEKKARLKALNKIQQAISLEKNTLLKNSVLEVLVEEVAKKGPYMLTGRTRTNKLVHFSGPASLYGRLVQVKITAAKTWHLKGELAE